MEAPRGPHRITSVRQVAIPADLLKQVGLAPGDQVYFTRSVTDPTSILVTPAAVVARRYAFGESAEILERAEQAPGREVRDEALTERD